MKTLVENIKVMKATLDNICPKSLLYGSLILLSLMKKLLHQFNVLTHYIVGNDQITLVKSINVRGDPLTFCHVGDVKNVISLLTV